MTELNLLKKLLHEDWKRSRTDSRLLWLLFSPLINTGGLYLLLPRLTWLLNNDWDIRPYIPLAIGFIFLWLTPLGIALWSALLLLEEKEEDLQTWGILPNNRTGFLAYRLWLPYLYSFFLIVTGLLFSNPGLLPLAPLGWIAFTAALQTPLLTLILFRFSTDRMQALKFTKGLQFFGLGMIFIFVWPPSFQNLAGLIFPPYWLIKTFLIGVNQKPGFALHLFLSLALTIALLNWAKQTCFKVYFQPPKDKDSKDSITDKKSSP